jgi:hypothetical protein
MASRRGAAGCSATVGVLTLLGLTGCGGEELKTYPVSGKVVLADGDVQQLAGSYVEFMLESDPLMRASGTIGPDGRFEVETLYKGKVLKGAAEGKYQARIILSDDDGGTPKRRSQLVHNRFLDFKTSGLSLTVPTSGEATFNVSRR